MRATGDAFIRVAATGAARQDDKPPELFNVAVALSSGLSYLGKSIRLAKRSPSAASEHTYRTMRVDLGDTES